MKYKVPDGMLKAATVAYNAKICSMGYKYVIDRNVTEATLEAALRWLAENPVIPTDEQISEYLYAGSNKNWLRDLLAIWQRRMFLAPEPTPTVRRVKDTLMGCTLTAGDAVELIDAIRKCTNPEPEVPEAIKDLLVMNDCPPHDVEPEDHDAHVLEAYKRGKNDR